MNNFIDSLLEKQHIGKRRRTGPAPKSFSRDSVVKNSSRELHFRFFREKFTVRKSAFRPAGIKAFSEQNSRIISRIKQNPSKVQRDQKNKRNSSRKSFLAFFFPEDNSHYVSDGEGKKTDGHSFPSTEHPKARNFSSLVLPAIPIAAFFVLAFGIFFVIYSQGFTLDWMDRQAVNFEKDEGSQYNLALYAGINPINERTASPSDNLNKDTEETIPLDLSETFAWQTYKVKKGDSVSKIAAAFSVSMDAVIASNNITNARSLREAQVLRIPNMDGIPYTVKNGDSLSKISKDMGVPLEAILDANDIQSDKINAGMSLFIPGARMKREELKMALGELFIYPLRGARLSSPFGWRDDPFTGVRSYHAAIDLSAPLGTSIKAAMDGKVSAQGYNGTYGNYIIISHSGGLQTMYAHMNTFSAKKGDQVSQGTLIGTVGSTGYSTGPHLHFAVFKNGRAVNPLDFLNPQR